MKLGALKAAIRDGDTPKIQVRLAGDCILDAILQKTPLLAELDRLFPEGKATETHLWVNADGFLTKEQDRWTSTNSSSGVSETETPVSSSLPSSS